MASLTISSPAKLNLALKIVGRRPDGFHDLQTIFERIDLVDTLTFSSVKDGGIHISCNHPSVPCDERNLVYKVARLLREEAGSVFGVKIHITKRIPVAAGLAGGSSNAAAALKGLNRFWRLGLSQEKLIRLAKKVGSDVAFFLYDAPFALGTERGDKIKVFDVRAKFWHVLIVPKAPLLTKDVYMMYAARFYGRNSSARRLNPARLTKINDNVTMLLCSLKSWDIPRVQAALFNDLEGPIGVLKPGLLKLKEKLKIYQSQGVCFSGSGPSIFALTATQAEAEKVAQRFRKAYTQVFVVQTL